MNDTEDYQREMTFFRRHLQLCDTGISKLPWFCSSMRNLTDCSNFSSWSLVTAIMQKKPHLHRISAHWPSYLEIPAQAQTPSHKFCTSWYQFLINNTNVKGTWEIYLPNALSSMMLALVSVCRKILINTGFHPVPPTHLGQITVVYTLFSTLVIFNKCNYLYSWFIRQPEALKKRQFSCSLCFNKHHELEMFEI